jgi:fructokinase
MNTVCCFGEALIDFHGTPSGSAPVFTAHPGGAPANVAVAVTRLGGEAAFVGMFGRDMFGDLLLRELAAAGVDITRARRTDTANTALAFVSHAADGERDFSFYRPPSADLLFRPEHFRADAFDGTAVFHVCSNSMTEPAAAETTREGMRRARDSGALVSFDLNLRPALWPHDADARAQAWPALQLADLVKLSAEEFAWLAVDGEDAVLERLWQGRTRLLVVTDGPSPLRWFHPDAEG